ncbi:MAG: hypothetical protein JSV88_16770 [Candidatus Aminicenantes bacterium]|nr:MAG: hypothetical protein JSV88_16770 [Candidatus Aminicenantes bacterium]
MRKLASSFSHVFAIILISGLVFAGCNVGVNRSIHIRDGETVNSGASTVNGSITVGNNCTIRGNCNTVNGRIKVGSDSEVRSLKTVNSGITVGKNTVVEGSIGTVNGSVTCYDHVKVDRSISTVNGSVKCSKGVRIEGSISNVNGNFALKNTAVMGDIKTHTGDITLLDKSIIEGDIIIKRSHSISRRLRTIDITISEGSVVKGDIIVKDDDLEVKVFLSQGGKVDGKVINAEVVNQ